MSISKDFTVTNKVGLHARPAARFVKAATKLQENSIVITNVTKQTPQVNAKSFTCVLSIGANQNDVVRLTIDGDNAEEAMATFGELFEANFGEEE
jgi:phosphotransferase system HPr (HPr) family protein